MQRNFRISTRKRVLATLATCVVSIGLAAGPASAANQNGLVNVDLTGNTVQVPVAVAANICGVAVNAIATGTFLGNTECTSTSRPSANGGGGNGGGNTNQQGLVNVALVDNTVQVPIGIAANICGVSANVIASNTFVGNTACDSVSEPGAEA